jgi:hypothetical protein
MERVYGIKVPKGSFLTVESCVICNPANVKPLTPKMWIHMKNHLEGLGHQLVENGRLIGLEAEVMARAYSMRGTQTPPATAITP